MITASYLKKILEYSPDDGQFTWLVTLSNRGAAGAVAGSRRSDGRVQIRIKGQIYFAHRLAWLYMTGKWPEQEIDHKNCDNSDNSWGNLRAATSSQNKSNTRTRRANKLQIKGVRRHWTGRYEAYITVSSKQIYLGGFASAAEASAAYAAAARKYHGEYARVA